jgi:hypothetical protein
VAEFLDSYAKTCISRSDDTFPTLDVDSGQKNEEMQKTYSSHEHLFGRVKRPERGQEDEYFSEDDERSIATRIAADIATIKKSVSEIMFRVGDHLDLLQLAEDCNNAGFGPIRDNQSTRQILDGPGRRPRRAGEYKKHEEPVMRKAWEVSQASKVDYQTQRRQNPTLREWLTSGVSQVWNHGFKGPGSS